MKKIRFLLLVMLAVLLAMPVMALAGEAKPAVDVPFEQETSAASEAAVEGIAPYMPEGELDKAVIGTDDRTLIRNRRQYPYSAVAYMIVTNTCGCQSTGTGFMVNTNTMMTAAHCLVCTTHGGLAEEVILYFGYDSDKNYLCKYDDSMEYWCGTYFEEGDGTYAYTYDHARWDYAFVRLNQNIGEKTGWFGLYSKEDAALNAELYDVTGYRRGDLKTSYGPVEVQNEEMIGFQIDTQPGNSGGPIYDSNNYAVAINVAESEPNQVNFGRRITDDILTKMRSLGLIQ